MTDKPDVSLAAESAACADLYRSMQLEGVVSWKAFRQAVTGYHKIADRKRDVLTLIDFSRPSTEKRLFVFDMKQRRLLFSSVVSHGKNSGDKYATSFSNEYGSYKSSLGFYLTETTYQGRNGYSLILNGLEKGINDRARERAIVVHGAAYADPSVASRGGRLGRSFGCPAVPQKLSRPIIDAKLVKEMLREIDTYQKIRKIRSVNKESLTTRSFSSVRSCEPDSREPRHRYTSRFPL